jgi:hypothetical protein
MSIFFSLCTIDSSIIIIFLSLLWLSHQAVPVAPDTHALCTLDEARC